MVGMKDAFIAVEEVMQILGIGKSKAYNIIKVYNAELEERGYLTIRGRCPRKYFEQKVYGYAECYNPADDLEKSQTVTEESNPETKQKVQSN